MSEARARVLPCGDAALLVELKGEGDDLTPRVLGLERAVAGAALPGIVECVPGLTTLLVEYDPLLVAPDTLAADLLILAASASVHQPIGRRFELPVCFEPDHGPDLAATAVAAGMPADDLVGLLCHTALRVALIGHLPGLPYLSGLPAVLDLPRRPTVRARVPAGSLGLAARMACVYPQTAPGGWHLVGRTPARLVDPESDPPVRLSPGDSVRLRAVDGATFGALADLEAAGEPALRIEA
ncbi:MAG TPA: allophanate hydrolase subunit 1 [Candidatus Dormibacteraeota bacterium]